MDNRLKLVAQEGDINRFYTLIEADPWLLDKLDKIPFVETPLHVAASSGHTQFAAEIMRLKPSFSEKPNQQGHTPLQVALQNMRIDTVHHLIAIDPQLIRVKWREGATPLHFAAESGDIELLKCFLTACPESIMETTVRNETALHIAVKNWRFDAFDVLAGRLRRALHAGSLDQEVKILGMKDIDGNTLLHIAAQTNQPQAVQTVLDSRGAAVKINEKNLEGLTALDISICQSPAQNNEINKMLERAGALRGISIPDRNKHHRASSKMPCLELIIVRLTRYKRSMSDSLLNAALVIMILVATVSYQAALSPPGGVWQDDGNNNSNTTSRNTTHLPGKSTMSYDTFLIFWFFNSAMILWSIMTILFLLPSHLILLFPLYLFVVCFTISMTIISPSPIAPWFSKCYYLIFCFSMAVIWFTNSE